MYWICELNNSMVLPAIPPRKPRPGEVTDVTTYSTPIDPVQFEAS